MLNSLALWKLLAAPVAAPLALTLVVAFAGPGGVLEPDNELGQRDKPVVHSVSSGPAADAAVSDSAPVEGTGATDPAAVTNVAGGTAGSGPATEVAPADAPVDAERGCVKALSEHAESRSQLEEHVADPDNPKVGEPERLQQAVRRGIRYG